MRWQRLVSVGWALGAALLMAAAEQASAQEIKIGFVSLERVLRDSAPAKAASQKLEAEFSKRDREMQEMVARLKSQAERLDKDAPVLAEAERNKRQRELAEMDREVQRRQREFREDFNQRRNEELQAVVERAQRVVRQIAESEKFDLILQDAVFISPRVDITDRVLRAMANGK
jgi:outer membrane protein